MAVTFIFTFNSEDAPEHDGENGKIIKGGLVEGVPVGIDPTTAHPQIPVVNSTIVVGSLTYFLDKIKPTKLNDSGSYQLAFYYSTDRRFRFRQVVRPDPLNPISRQYEVTREPVTITIPRYTRAIHNSRDSNDLPIQSIWWKPDHMRHTVEFAVLNVQLTITGVLTLAQQRAIIAEGLEESGKIHEFDWTPSLRFTRWLMGMPRITNTVETTIVNYSWKADPGNSAPNASADKVAGGIRPSFYKYKTVTGQTPNAPPTISVEDLFPAVVNGSPNPYYNPLGWQSLPGNPLA